GPPGFPRAPAKAGKAAGVPPGAGFALPIQLPNTPLASDAPRSATGEKLRPRRDPAPALIRGPRSRSEPDAVAEDVMHDPVAGQVHSCQFGIGFRRQRLDLGAARMLLDMGLGGAGKPLDEALEPGG